MQKNMNIEVLHRENYDLRQKLEKAEVKIDKLEREIEQLHIKNDQLKQIENTAPTASNYASFHEKSLWDPKLKFDSPLEIKKILKEVLSFHKLEIKLKKWPNNNTLCIKISCLRKRLPLFKMASKLLKVLSQLCPLVS